MILSDLDLHFRLKEHLEPWSRPQNRVRRLVESVWLRLPRTVSERVRTRSFGKLNITVSDHEQFPREFTSVLGIAEAFLREPKSTGLASMSDEAIDDLVLCLLRRGLEIAAKHDDLLAQRLGELLTLVDASVSPYDHHLLRRSHRSRRWRAELVLHTSPAETALEVVIIESKTGTEVERHRIGTPSAALLYFLDEKEQVAIHWDGDEVVCIDSACRETVRIRPKLPMAGARTRGNTKGKGGW